MDNLSAFHSPRFVYDGDGYRGNTDCCRGRTTGIRRFLAQDGYLLSRYSTLIRYKRLAGLLRRAADVDECADLLWGLEASSPAVWGLSEVVRFKVPIPCRGSVGMWRMPDSLAAQVTAADEEERAFVDRCRLTWK